MKNCCNSDPAPKNKFSRLLSTIGTAIILLFLAGGLVLTLIRILRA